MHISGLTIVLNFILGIAFSSHISSNSSSRLARRDHDHGHPPFSNVYIMKDKLDYSKGGLVVYYPNGSVAYIFNKSVHDVRHGISTVELKDPHKQPLLTLNSQDDTCFSKTHYVESEGSPSHHRFEIDPRGVKTDRWSFRYITPEGEEITYRYERNFLNKGGHIYESRKGGDELYVGVLEDQLRWESWFEPGPEGAKTFTLSCTSTAPQIEFATLMALVLTRVDACKL